MHRDKREKNCEHPERLNDEPADCSPEQIRQCHDKTACHPCLETTDCEQPGRLEGEPGECSPELIRQCHGKGSNHPCE